MADISEDFLQFSVHRSYDHRYKDYLQRLQIWLNLVTKVGAFLFEKKKKKNSMLCG